LFLERSLKEFFEEEAFDSDQDKPEDLRTDKVGEAQSEPLNISPTEFVSWVSAQKVEDLLKLKPKSFYPGFKKISDLKVLSQLAEDLLKTSSSSLCMNPSLTTALAQKFETFLPDLKLKELSLKLYDVMVKCPSPALGTESRDSIDRARYRRALWFWADKDYENSKVTPSAEISTTFASSS
jgi:hypothetical protein